MKIAHVDAFVLKTPLDEPFAFSQGWVHQRSATLVRITTDNGIVGWGEAFAQGLEPPEIAAAAINHAFKPLVMGCNPLDTSVLWNKMYAHSRDYGRKGTIVSAISAIDIALWDIAGKFYSQPIYQLLGGAQRTQVKPYATGFYRLKGKHEAPRLAKEALDHRASGFRAMKVKLGFGIDDDIEVMSAINTALDDPGIEIMVDTNHAYGRSEALKLGKSLEAFNIRWYEEPVVPEDIASYKALRTQLSMPIAGGENEHTAYGFNQLFQQQALDIAQPDVGSCGGITAMQNITAMAQANGVQVNPHVWGAAVAQAASLQIIAALPVAHHSLFPTEPILEYDRSSHPFRQQLIESVWSIKNGAVTIPSDPGLGISVNMDVVTEYCA